MYFGQGTSLLSDFMEGALVILRWNMADAMMKKPKKKTWMKRPPVILFVPRFWSSDDFAFASMPPLVCIS